MKFTDILTQNALYYDHESGEYIKTGTVWDTAYEIGYLVFTGYLLSNYWSEKRRKITNLEKIMLAVETKS